MPMTIESMFRIFYNGLVCLACFMGGLRTYPLHQSFCHRIARLTYKTMAPMVMSAGIPSDVLTTAQFGARSISCLGAAHESDRRNLRQALWMANNLILPFSRPATSTIAGFVEESRDRQQRRDGRDRHVRMAWDPPCEVGAKDGICRRYEASILVDWVTSPRFCAR